ncbi:hypothetical protein EDC01DRAFT_633846 [Geopyxis carbonaria]|nr:hypothetical protein EDC01DRAFT_633846 [Geopyxis carbonaria]
MSSPSSFSSTSVEPPTSTSSSEEPFTTPSPPHERPSVIPRMRSPRRSLWVYAEDNDAPCSPAPAYCECTFCRHCGAPMRPREPERHTVMRWSHSHPTDTDNTDARSPPPRYRRTPPHPERTHTVHLSENGHASPPQYRAQASPPRTMWTHSADSDAYSRVQLRPPPERSPAAPLWRVVTYHAEHQVMPDLVRAPRPTWARAVFRQDGRAWHDEDWRLGGEWWLEAEVEH